MKLDTTDYSHVFSGTLKIYVRDNLFVTAKKDLRKKGNGMFGVGEKVLREIFWRYEKTFEEWVNGADGKRFYEGTFLCRRDMPWSAVRKLCRHLLKRIKKDLHPNAFDFLKRPDYHSWEQFSCLPFTNSGVRKVTPPKSGTLSLLFHKHPLADAGRSAGGSSFAQGSSFVGLDGRVLAPTTTQTLKKKSQIPSLVIP